MSAGRISRMYYGIFNAVCISSKVIGLKAQSTHQYITSEIARGDMGEFTCKIASEIGCAGCAESYCSGVVF